MVLDPDSFECEQHVQRQYLTAAVRVAVETEGHYFPMEDVPADAVGRFSESASASRGDFKVLVNCPGPESGGDGQPHPLVFEGVWSK